MNIVFDALQTIDRLSLGDTFIAGTIGAAICIAGPLVHETGHLLPARLLCRSGRIALFPFRALGGFRAWVIIFAVELPDEQLRRISAGKAAALLAGGAIAAWHLSAAARSRGDGFRSRSAPASSSPALRVLLLSGS